MSRSIVAGGCRFARVFGFGSDLSAFAFAFAFMLGDADWRGLLSFSMRNSGGFVPPAIGSDCLPKVRCLSVLSWGPARGVRCSKNEAGLAKKARREREIVPYAAVRMLMLVLVLMLNKGLRAATLLFSACRCTVSLFNVNVHARVHVGIESSSLQLIGGQSSGQ